MPREPGVLVERRLECCPEKWPGLARCDHETGMIGVGQTLKGRYRLVDEIGGGGMGVVYKALDLDARPPPVYVAVKVIDPANAGDARYRQRFVNEFSAASRIRSSHVVAALDQGEFEGELFMVMEYIDARNLAEIVRDGGPLTTSLAARLIAEIGAGLSAAHRVGVLHRDVKPSNVLVQDVNGESRFYLSDFGIAKRLDATEGITEEASPPLGTSGYMAPEQGHPDATKRCDVFSLGQTLYFALTGRDPHAYLPTREILPKQDPRPPYRFWNVIARATDAAPNARYDSVESLVQAVRRARKSTPVAAVVRQANEYASGIPILASASAALAVVAALVVAFLSNDRPEPTARLQRVAADQSPSREVLSATDVSNGFYRLTGDRLRVVTGLGFDVLDLATNSLDASLDDWSAAQDEYGSFQIFLWDHPTTAQREAAENLGKEIPGSPQRGDRLRPTPAGIYWEGRGPPGPQRTWTAKKAFGNLELNWYPKNKRTDHRWFWLAKIMRMITATVPPGGLPSCARQGSYLVPTTTGECKLDGQTLKVVNAYDRLELPRYAIDRLTVLREKEITSCRWSDSVAGARALAGARGELIMLRFRLTNRTRELLPGWEFRYELVAGPKTYEGSAYDVLFDDRWYLRPSGSRILTAIFDLPEQVARQALREGTLAVPGDNENLVTVADAATVGMIRLVPRPLLDKKPCSGFD